MSDFPWLRCYPEGVSHDCHVSAASLWDVLEQAGVRAPDAPALVYQGAVTTYGTLVSQATAAGTRIGPGSDPVVLALPDVPAFAVAFFGAMRSGRMVVPLSPQLTAAEIVAALMDTRPGAIVVASRLEDTYRRALSETDLHPAVITPTDDWATPDAGDPSPAAAVLPDDIAVLQYTSGTTGGLKAAMMTHHNLLANAGQNNAWFAWRAGDVVAGALPLCHTWGLSCVLVAAVSAGASIVLFEPSDSPTMLRQIEDHEVSIMYGSATLFDRLLDAAGDDAARVFHRCRYVKAGAMLVGGRLPERWAAAVPEVPMELGYGLTEASPEVCDNPPGRHKKGTVGVPLPGTEVRICSPEDASRVLSTDAVGEIQVRGPQVMRGYWRRPDATAAQLIPDGWLRTGDLGRLDADGYLTIVDRLKDLIKFRGWSVVPAEVERALLRHPDVREVAVVGRRHPTDGEEPMAFVVVADGRAPTDDQLDTFLAEHLARYKRPRHYRFVEAIPKNIVGKPLRRALREDLG